MKFYLWMKQKGDGCDYTIGCAQKLLELRAATTLGEARQEALKAVEDYGFLSGGDDRQLEKAVIFTDGEDAMPLVRIALDAAEERREEERKNAKREQIEKLKKELGE